MTDDKKDLFRYDKMVEKALRDVVKQALEELKEKGLVDEHHFYITFFTNHKGVSIPKYLKEKYPEEMTIVLQHQFHDLEIKKDKAIVTLSFNNVPEKLIIPFNAITIFADPSVNFALQFQPMGEYDEHGDSLFDEEDIQGDSPAKDMKKGEVISLDSFRKKDSKKDK